MNKNFYTVAQLIDEATLSLDNSKTEEEKAKYTTVLSFLRDYEDVRYTDDEDSIVWNNAIDELNTSFDEEELNTLNN